MRGEVELKDVSFRYQTGNARGAAQHPNLHIAAGRTVALVGANRRRQKLYCQPDCPFYDATEGQVLIDGIDVQAVQQQSLRAQTGIVSQDPFLFSGHDWRQYSFGNEAAAEAAVQLPN
ncbi:MAG: hypothetical protein H6656_13255 [Ardenticatenaceae bacterium]|nr:hypothetical protein [Ardenticatenaceae bacterium]